jgi:hypothetical protein
MNRKQEVCEWCEQKYRIGLHECPSLFIHKSEEHEKGKEIIIRGDFEVEWVGNNILIKGEYYREPKGEVKKE